MTYEEFQAAKGRIESDPWRIDSQREDILAVLDEVERQRVWLVVLQELDIEHRHLLPLLGEWALRGDGPPPSKAEYAEWFKAESSRKIEPA